MPPSTEFIKVINDFIRDIGTTFPEYSLLLQKWSGNNDRLYEFCVKKYLPRSTDFLNKNEDIFSEDSEVDTEFLPHIHFKNLWQYEDLSEQSKDSIWSYLQLITIALGVDQEGSGSGTISSPSEEDMNEMVQNALEHMSTIWKKEESNNVSEEHPEGTASSSSSSAGEDPSVPPLSPDMFESIFTGKLASIAKELAEETAGSFNFKEDSTLEEATKQLFTNPGNLSSVMKTVSEKLEERMQSGELNQEELMTEAMAMMGKMGSIPGLSNIFNNMSNLGNLGKSPKAQQLSRQEKIKARLRNKVNNNNKMSQLNKNMK